MYSKADTHMHTTYSDGLMSPEDTIEIIASQSDLRVIAITDHDTAEGAFVAQAYARRRKLPLEVIIGQEFSTMDGDVVGLFLKSTLPHFKTAAQAIDAIHAQGGLAVAVHPFSRWATLNNMCGLGTKIFDLPLDGVEVRNGFPTNLLSNPLATWLNRHHGQNLSELGGSDSHAPFTAGQAFTWFEGRTADDLRWAIESGATRAGGGLWTPVNLARMIPMLLKQGLPHYEHVYSD
ncbi:MAG: PHP domain-containing protein [Chloroflexi bacterium]|nr:PHP domain-containing protein [Chloroflexota bacterium]